MLVRKWFLTKKPIGLGKHLVLSAAEDKIQHVYWCLNYGLVFCRPAYKTFPHIIPIEQIQIYRSFIGRVPSPVQMFLFQVRFGGAFLVVFSSKTRFAETFLTNWLCSRRQLCPHAYQFTSFRSHSPDLPICAKPINPAHD